jgi:hypothetical protein
MGWMDGLDGRANWMVFEPGAGECARLKQFERY